MRVYINNLNEDGSVYYQNTYEDSDGLDVVHDDVDQDEVDFDNDSREREDAINTLKSSGEYGDDDDIDNGMAIKFQSHSDTIEEEYPEIGYSREVDFEDGDEDEDQDNDNINTDIPILNKDGEYYIKLDDVKKYFDLKK